MLSLMLSTKEAYSKYQNRKESKHAGTKHHQIIKESKREEESNKGLTKQLLAKS